MDNNIHRLDKKLPPYEFKLPYSSSEEEKEQIRRLSELPISQDSMRVLQVLLADIGGPKGYDRTNDVSIDHLLFELSSYMNKLSQDNLDLLESYLIEMKSGMCAEGRSHRLRQFLFTLK